MSQHIKDTQPIPSDISPITDIIAELRAGRMVILVDEEDRENEGDLVLAAEFVTPDAINFMVTHGRGLVCLTLTEDHCHQLDLPLMAVRNGTKFGTNFTVSIEAAEGVETGISAADRARTVRAAVARDARPTDLVQPGHIFPLKAENGGVLIRAGHTEAGCDLTRMAGLTPASVICEILNPDGTMARLPQLLDFAKQHNLKIGTIADLIQYRSATESMIERLFDQNMSTPWGTFRAIGYKDLASGSPHLALVHGEIKSDVETLVRVHEPTTIIDLLCADSSDHSWSIPDALKTISKATSGVVVMLNCQGSEEKIFEQFNLRSDQSAEAKPISPAEPRYDLRTYGIGAQILRDLDVGQARLLAHPRKMPSMTGFALTVTGYLTEPTA